jgi:hypothetical protein
MFFKLIIKVLIRCSTACGIVIGGINGRAKAVLHPLPGLDGCDLPTWAFLAFPERGAKM